MQLHSLLLTPEFPDRALLLASLHAIAPLNSKSLPGSYFHASFFSCPPTPTSFSTASSSAATAHGLAQSFPFLNPVLRLPLRITALSLPQARTLKAMVHLAIAHMLDTILCMKAMERLAMRCLRACRLDITQEGMYPNTTRYRLMRRVDTSDCRAV